MTRFTPATLPSQYTFAPALSALAFHGAVGVMSLLLVRSHAGAEYHPTGDKAHSSLSQAPSKSDWTVKPSQSAELHDLVTVQTELETQLEALNIRRQSLDAEHKRLERRDRELEGRQKCVIASMTDASQKQNDLAGSLRSTRELAKSRRIELLYDVPLMKPSQPSGIGFECRYGRVTPINLSGLFTLANKHAATLPLPTTRTPENASLLSLPIDAFRLRYTIEWEQFLPDQKATNDRNSGSRAMRPKISNWSLEPAKAPRGEALPEALVASSEFRAAVDRIDPKAVGGITIWVYPDSFALYQALARFLRGRNLAHVSMPVADSSNMGP